MKSCHKKTTQPSHLLALICLTIVYRLRPKWVALPVKTACAEVQLNPERVSRLTTQLLERLEQLVTTQTRFGRPKKDIQHELQTKDHAIKSALLDVATQVLSHVSLRKPALRAMIVGAYLRLKKEHSINQKTFCSALSIAPRTLRHWRQNTATQLSLEILPSKSNPPRKRPLRRGRFGFDVTLPGTQLAADTTGLEVFDVPLKLIAAQDIADRNQDLLTAVIVEHSESADLVAKVLTEAIDNRPGLQILTDQGTPYMAHKIDAVLEQLDAEHAPQKEAHPQGKATIERAFKTIKSIAKPLFEITGQLAKKIPELKNTKLAQATAIVFVTALLKAYQAGARAMMRADQDRLGLSPDVLAERAEQSRNLARAELHSTRLFLTQLHQDYNINRPLNKFISSMKRFPLTVLKNAEKDFATQVHRHDIRSRASYFAAIARKQHEHYRLACIKTRLEHEQQQKLNAKRQYWEDQYRQWKHNPTQWLYDALQSMAHQWIPEKQQLLFDGVGPARSWIKSSIDAIFMSYPEHIANQTVISVFWNFADGENNRIGPNGTDVMRRLIQKMLDEKNKKLNPNIDETDCTTTFSATLLHKSGPFSHPAPDNSC